MKLHPRASRPSMLASLFFASICCAQAATAQAAVCADAVVHYIPAFSGGSVPTVAHDPAAALGAPDYAGRAGEGYVSLGCGGLLEVLFASAQVSNDGKPSADLQIVEVEDTPEAVNVWVLPADEPTQTALALAAQVPNSDGFYFAGTAPGGTSGLDLDTLAPESPAGVLRFNVVRLVDQDFMGAPSPSAGADIDAVSALFPAHRVHQPNSARASLEVLGVSGHRYPLRIEANVNDTPMFSLEVIGPPNRPFVVALAPAGLVQDDAALDPALGFVDLDLGMGLTILMDGISSAGELGLDHLAKTGPDGRRVIAFAMPQVRGPFHLGGLQALVQASADELIATAASDVMLVAVPVDAIYVSADGGNDRNPGTSASPKASVKEGIAAAVSERKARVIVAAGTYAEDPRFVAGVEVSGGWAPGAVWTKPPTSWSDVVTRVTISDSSPETLAISGFRFLPPTPATPGASSVAVEVNRTPAIVFQNCRFIPGAGAAGVAGQDGVDAFTPRRWDAAGGDGGQGGNAAGESGARGKDGRTCSAAKVGVAGSGGAGSSGGSAEDGHPGSRGSHGVGGGAGDGALLYVEGAIDDLAAGDGLAGRDGASGAGGGGGGGGGATVAGRRVLIGGDGGGGGDGGRPGQGGEGGRGGGASVAVAIYDANPMFEDCFFRAGRGGDGGAGGRGGTGELGQNGGRGGRGQGSGSIRAGDGGSGAAGGTGGPGGGGGGGAGGASFGIFRGRRGFEVLVGPFNEMILSTGGSGGRGGDAAGLDGIAAHQGLAGPTGASGAVR